MTFFRTLALICALVVAGITHALGATEYPFVMVSHIGPSDPNMKWLTMALEDFETKYPNVETEYVSTNVYSIQELVRLLEQVIASRPDGIAVPILNIAAQEGPLRDAIGKGIPVVAFNVPDTRPLGERIPYLTYVGGDEYLTGRRLAEYVIAQADAGRIPDPKGMVCAIPDLANQGAMARCAGLRDAMLVH
jgi:simple sugar transport system substrate-binding protein